MGESLLSLSSVYVQLRPSDGYSYSCAGRSNFHYGRSRSRSRSRRASFVSGQHLYISSTNKNRCNRWRKSDVDRGQSSVAVTAVRGDGKESLEPVAVEEANERAAAAEEERRKAVEELGKREMELKEYADALARSTRAAVSELEAAKKGFQEELQKLVDNKLEVESELILSRQNALDLALQVEKIAENAIEEATAHIVQEAKLRVSAAETSAAQVALDAERHISSATDSVTVNVIQDLRTAFDKSLSIAQLAREEADRAQASLEDKLNTLDDLVHSETSHISLQRAVHDLERQLKLQQNETKRLELELMSAEGRIASAEARAVASDKALKKLADSANRGGVKQEENAKHALEELKRVVKEREEASALAFNSELESMRSAIDALRSAESVKEEAYLRRFVALERALVSAEATANAWKNRSQTAEMLLQKANQDNVTEYVLNGGRMDFLIKDDDRKLNLLVHGPRSKMPEWISRRLDFVCQKFPPLKVTLPEEDVECAVPLVLPQPDQVWSIAKEKRKVQDEFTLRAVEEEAIKKKRQALEQVLKDKTLQRKRVPEETKLEPGTGTGREIVFQGFNWESWRRRWYLELAPKAADLSHSGITSIWLPPPTESVAPQGYMPLDLYNLNSAYGTQEELKQCIEELHKYDLLALGDAVLNHRCAHKQSPNGIWNIFGGKLPWGPDAIVRDDPNFQGRGNPSSGDIFHAAPNIDHSQDFVRKDIKEWLQWLRTDIGFDGWRLDFVRGFWGGHVKEYIEASNPAFSIGEYWDSMAYEGGNLCYNQNAHRQRIINWINATGGTSSAFDVTTKGILHSALHNQYWRLIDPQGKPTGVMGWWPSRAVTYLENHDTGSTQGHWPFPRDKLMQGYAYILTHPGTPSIFYDHFYDFGLRDQITELIEARTLAGIHCRSPLQIFEANKDGYVAQVGEKLVLKLGHLDWNPSKQHDLAGIWHSFCDYGNEFKIWVKE